MANAILTYERLEFIIEEELTHCNVLYSSNEPGTPWGGGWKTKTFPPSKSCADILEEIDEFISWNDGRSGVKD